MFGLSMSKILLIAAVIAAVWFTLKYVSRKVDDAVEDKPADKLRAGRGGGGAKGRDERARGGPEEARAVEDMVRCRVCGAYQARNAGPCERPDCPQR